MEKLIGHEDEDARAARSGRRQADPGGRPHRTGCRRSSGSVWRGSPFDRRALPHDVGSGDSLSTLVYLAAQGGQPGP
jgi:hypothetical protein